LDTVERKIDGLGDRLDANRETEIVKLSILAVSLVTGAKAPNYAYFVRVPCVGELVRLSGKDESLIIKDFGLFKIVSVWHRAGPLPELADVEIVVEKLGD